MNILVIAQNLDYTAPGNVFKNIIKGISRCNSVDLLYNGKFDESQLTSVRRFYSCQSNFFYNYLGRKRIFKNKSNPYSKKWIEKALRIIEGNKYDIVCSMLTSSYYYPILCGKLIADKCYAKYAVYSVDAIPAPGWGESTFSRFQLELVKNELKHCDYFATINPKMLDYQLSTFENKPGLKHNVIYIPIDENIKQIGPATEKHTFLYTGGIYGKRKIDKIIKAFNKICNTYEDAKLILVGTHLRRSYIEQIARYNSKSIELHRYAKDLTPFYKRASVFLNIDADIPNDVFLASKLMKYLPYNRQILCETGENSPTHLLLDGFDTVVICHHDEEELYQGMLKVLKNVDTAEYSERDILLHELSIESQGKKLAEDLVFIL
ncbi:MAG: glycosyltransferase [Spirochaetaceae bacterium]|nr:glycosyltransferase [Spirochaetaceae bacterium]